MPTPSMFNIQDALVSIVQGAAVGAKIWDRVRIAENESEYLKYYIDDNKIGNVWFVRRIGFTSEVDEMGTPISITHLFELRHFRMIVDNDDHLQASERVFQMNLELVRLAINSSNDLTLGNQIRHTGLSTSEAVPMASSLGANEGHMGTMNLSVIVTEC